MEKRTREKKGKKKRKKRIKEDRNAQKQNSEFSSRTGVRETGSGFTSFYDCRFLEPAIARGGTR